MAFQGVTLGAVLEQRIRNYAMSKVNKSDEEWKQQLGDDVYRVTRQQGTEPAFSGAYYKNQETGVYHCVCCGAELFTSVDKYDSGSGWPSFWQPVNEHCISEIKDTSHGMVRVEVRCSQCDSHLGHVFPDGPEPTGLRYCINSVCLDFKKA